jgi:gliding motility associated protien GldN
MSQPQNAVSKNDSVKSVQKPNKLKVEGGSNTPGGRPTSNNDRTPIPITPIREADAMWRKIVWQYIDVKEKINQTLYFPTEPQGDRICLLDLLKYATMTDTILVANRLNTMSLLYPNKESSINNPLLAYDNEYVNIPITKEMIITKFGYQKKMKQKKIDGDGQPTDEDTSFTLIIPLTSREIVGYEFKEEWFFDKQRSVLDNQHILAIRPIFQYEKEDPNNGAAPIAGATMDDEESGEFETAYGPWFYFPELRNFTASADVFNQLNRAESKSFDDIFMKRHFSSVIKAEENEKNNRKIQEYIMYGLDQVLASEKIKDDIRKFEHDLWEF